MLTHAQLLLAILALAFAVSIWCVLVRPVAEQTTIGTITSRTFQPAETVKKLIPRTGRSLEHLQHEVEYALADRYLFSIRLDGRNGDARFSAIATATQSIYIGQQVRVAYFERYLPFVGVRIYVKKIVPLTDPRPLAGLE